MLFEMCYRISRLLFLLLLTRESSPTDCPPTVGWLSTDQELVDRRPTQWPAVDRLVIRKYTDSRSTVDWPTVGRCIDRRSVDTSADALADSRPTVDQRELKYTWSNPFIILNYLIYYRGTNNVSVCLTGKKHYVIRSIIFLLLNQDG